MAPRRLALQWIASFQTLVCVSLLWFGNASLSMAEPASNENPERTLFQREVEVFNHNDFSQAAMIGKLLLDSYPNNAQARYYYASALVRLGRCDEALAEYSQAYNCAKDQKLKSYCQTAIGQLSRAKLPFSPKQDGASSLLNGSSAASAANLHNSSSDPGGGTSLLERKASVLEEGVRTNQRLRDRAQEDIDRLRNEVADQLSQIPREIPGVRTFRYQMPRMIPNPEYTEASKRLNAEANQKIEQINKELQKRLDETTAVYQKQAASFDDTVPNMKSQMKPGNSLIQMTPQNTNPYLRNYMNYDGSFPGALKAKAGSLPQKANEPPASK